MEAEKRRLLNACVQEISAKDAAELAAMIHPPESVKKTMEVFLSCA